MDRNLRNRWNRRSWKRLSMAGIMALTVGTLSACGGEGQDVSGDILAGQGSVEAASAQGQAAQAAESLLQTEEMFTDRDLSGEYDREESVSITLDGESALCDSSEVAVSDHVVTITAEGVYVLSGSYDGMIVVEAGDSDKVQIVLDGAQIRNETNAAIYAKEADKVFLTLAEGSQNSLFSGGYTDVDGDHIDGAVFAKCDLTFNGTGSLTVEAAEGHGIVSKDDLALADAALTVTAAEHGLEGKDSVRVSGGQLNITSGKDGIHAENDDDAEKGYVYLGGGQIVIVSDGDGISAGSSLQVDGGAFDVLSGGGSTNGTAARDENGDVVSAKAFKADGAMVINGGTLVVNAQDDALHAGGDLTVNGGTLQLATGDDGLHSDGTTTVAGGSVDITDGYEGIEGNYVEISGGEIYMNVTDDGLNAAGGNDQSGFGGWMGGEMFGGSDSTVTISGGKIYVRAAGDGIDSNGDLIVAGGETYVSGPENGANGALDYGGSGQITGGVLVAVGSSQMAMNFGDTSTQGSVLVSVSACQAGDEVQMLDSQGNVLVSFTAESSFESVLVSCPQLEQGGTYTLKAGENETEIVLESLIYGNGMGGFGGPGGMGGFDRRGGSGGMGGFDGGEGTEPSDPGRRGSGLRQDGEMPEGGPGLQQDGEMPEGRSGLWQDGEMPEGGPGLRQDGEMPEGGPGLRQDGEMPEGGIGGLPEPGETL